MSYVKGFLGYRMMPVGRRRARISSAAVRWRDVRGCQFTICVLALIVLRPSRAGQQAVLIGPELDTQRVVIQSLRHGKISFFDERRHLRVEPVSRFLQIRFKKSSMQGRTEKSPRLDLIDGQRIPLIWRGEDEAGQRLLLAHPLCGELTVRLDDVWALKQNSVPLPPRSSRDQVLLANGDRVEGYVRAVRPMGIELQQGGNRAVLQLGLDRIAALRLSNTRRRPRPGVHLVHLQDGTRLASDAIEIEADRVELRLLLATVTSKIELALEQIRQIDVATASSRLVDLVDLEPSTVQGGEVFTAPMPPRITDDGLLLHAPVVSIYPLPAGAMRFAAVASLAQPNEPSPNWRWTDLWFILRVDGKIIVREHMNAQRKQIDVYASTHGRELSIEVHEGSNGPIMDRLLLRDAVLLVKQGN